MDSASFEHNTVGECGCCGAVFVVKGAYKISEMTDAYEEHLASTPACKEWHDNLPTLESMRGILGPAPSP